MRGGGEGEKKKGQIGTSPLTVSFNMNYVAVNPLMGNNTFMRWNDS